MCPGDDVVFTCNSTSGLISWALDSNGITKRTFTSANQVNSTETLGIFRLVLTSINSLTITSTATVYDSTTNQTSTNIYCANTAGIFNQIAQMATVNVIS